MSFQFPLKHTGIYVHVGDSAAWVLNFSFPSFTHFRALNDHWYFKKRLWTLQRPPQLTHGLWPPVFRSYGYATVVAVGLLTFLYTLCICWDGGVFISFPTFPFIFWFYFTCVLLVSCLYLYFCSLLLLKREADYGGRYKDLIVISSVNWQQKTVMCFMYSLQGKSVREYRLENNGIYSISQLRVLSYLKCPFPG